MKQSLKNEFKDRAIDYVKDGVLTLENQSEWHFYLFNEDYYIIGYYNAEQWLKEHNISISQAIQEVAKYEEDNYGQAKIYDDIEQIVNMYAYVLGEEWMYEEGEDFILGFIND